MLLRGMRVEDGQFKLDGYPEGSSVRGLSMPQAPELCRLMLFRSDLTRVIEWLSMARELNTEEPLQEAFCSAALVKFCCCFDGTAGLRSMPLRRKNIFRGEDRQSFERLLLIRNKAVAHDEHLYPGEFPLIVLDERAKALEAVVLQLRAPFSAMQEVEELRRLAKVALDWVMAEFEAIAKEVVDTINSLPEEQRLLMRDSTPDVKIQFGEAEDRFVKK